MGIFLWDQNTGNAFFLSMTLTTSWFVLCEADSAHGPDVLPMALRSALLKT